MRKSTQILLIILAGFIFYFNSLFNGFVWDDEFLIKDNPHIRSIKKAATFAISSDIFPGEGLHRKTNYYRPLQTISYSLDYFLWRESPFGYHLFNLCLHIINAILVYLIILLLSNLPLLAFISGLFFVVHPVHHEAVSYISGRADLLSAFFIMSSFYCLIKLRDNAKVKVSVPYFSLSFIFFVLAILSKEYALVIPLLFLIYDYSFKKLKKENLIQYFLFLPLIFVYLMLRVSALGFNSWFPGGRYGYLIRQDFLSRLLTFIKSIPFYLELLFLPTFLHMNRSFGKPTSLFDPWVWLSLIFLSLCFFISKKTKEKNPLPIFFFAWFIILVFFQSPVFMAGFVFAEHFLYLASISILFAFSYKFEQLFLQNKENPKKKRLSIIILFSLIIFYGSLTSIHNLNWRDNLTFYKWTLKFSPKSIRVRINLGNEYASRARYKEALAEYKKAKDLLDEVSISRYKDKPILKSKLTKQIVKTYYNLAVVKAGAGNIEEAEALYQEALRLNPHYILARNNLASLLSKTNREEEAIEQLYLALELDPSNLKVYYNLGAILANIGEEEEAREIWQESLKIAPDNQEIINALERLSEE